MGFFLSRCSKSSFVPAVVPRCGSDLSAVSFLYGLDWTDRGEKTPLWLSALKFSFLAENLDRLELTEIFKFWFEDFCCCLW